MYELKKSEAKLQMKEVAEEIPRKYEKSQKQVCTNASVFQNTLQH